MQHQLPPLKSFTVVYTVRDEAAFRASDEWRRIHDYMASTDNAAPFTITAMSHDHEMRRASLMEGALERYGDGYDLRETIEAIAGCPDLSEWSWTKFDEGEDC